MKNAVPSWLVCSLALGTAASCGHGTPPVDHTPPPSNTPDASQLPQPCVGPDGCDGLYDPTGTVCNAPRRNNCGACGASNVPGIGVACNGPAGRSGIAVCSVDGMATTCATTVVSLTIDDTFSDATRARDAYEAHGIRATFFVNSPRFDFGGKYMTLDQVLDLQHRGHEVGGHTLDHPDLPTLTVDQQHVEICNDRKELLALGLDIKSFAYPFGDNTSATQQAVRDCNYNTGRQIGGISEGSETAAETFVPQNLFALRTPTSLGMQNSLDDIKAYVTNAESVGGWIIINMHHIVLDPGPACTADTNCPSTERCLSTGQCGEFDPDAGTGTTSMYEGTLNAFLDWLEPRSAQGTVTQTIRQMTWAATLPAVDWQLPPAPDGGNLLTNPSFETLDSASKEPVGDGAPPVSLPVGWGPYGSGNNESFFDAGTPHTGAVGESVMIDQYISGGRGWMSSHDYGAFAPVPTPGHTYQVSAWYIAPDNTPQFEIDYLTAGTWVTYAISPRYPATASYAQASWVLPPLPDIAERMSVGLMLRSIGTLTVDDLSLKDTQ